MAALLEVRALTVELPTENGWVRPVAEISLTINAGETVGLVGESGSGKTMLALALMGLTPPGARVRGEAVLQARPESNPAASFPSPAPPLNLLSAPPAALRAVRGREVAMIFQEPMTALNPVMPIGAQVAEAVRAHEPALRSAELRKRVTETLAMAAVPEPERRARQYPHQLSGGLRQRALLAMALAASPRLLIADEPTTALDATVQKQILSLLGRLRGELRLAMLFITHDLGVVAQLADRVAVMYAGRVVEEGPAGEVLRRPRHPYTAGLLRAAPRLERGMLEPIPGTPPRFDALPPGCAFAPRCREHRAECDVAMPALRAAAPHHHARCILVP